MINIKKSLSAAISTALMLVLSGCYSMPSMEDYHQVRGDDLKKEAEKSDEWLQNPPIVRNFSRVGTTIQQPNVLPDPIANRQIQIGMTPKTTLNDVLTAISYALDIPTVASDSELAARLIYMPRYEGKLGDLLSTISRSQNIAFEWKDSTLVMRNSAGYVVTMPQDQELLDSVAAEITAIGGLEVNPSVASGLIFYRATPESQDRISHYLDRMVKNSALITLQVMVLNVNLERNRKTGFDWSNLQAKLGDMSVNVPSFNSDDEESTEDASAGGTTTRTIGRAATVSGNGMAFRLSKHSVDIAGLLNLLSTYGNTKTTQDVSLMTLSGKEVKLESAQKIPYVSDVDLSTTDRGLSNSGVETDFAKNGITMSFMPHYEADSQLVSVNLDINMETLLGFVELSAGNQLGSITQPRTQLQSFNNTVRVPVGDTVILGGVTYESISDNRSSLSVFDDLSIADKNAEITSNALFVLIRPTVVTYEPEEVTP